MAKRPAKVKLHPSLEVVTKIFGGKQKVARTFLDQLFQHGFHIAKNQRRKPPEKAA